MGTITSGCALIIAILLVLCGSSVYVQKKSFSLLAIGTSSFFNEGSAFILNVAVPFFLLVAVVTVEVAADMIKRMNTFVCDLENIVE